MLTGPCERPHAHGLYGILEIASVFSLVIIVNLLLGLTYKSTFVAGVCAEENVQCVYGSALPAVPHIRGGAWNAFLSHRGEPFRVRGYFSYSRIRFIS